MNTTKKEYKYLIFPALQYDFAISVILVIITLLKYDLFIANQGYIFPIISLAFTFVISFDSVYNENRENKINDIAIVIATIVLICVSLFLIIQSFTKYESLLYLIITKSSISFAIAQFRYEKQKNKKGLLIF